MIDKLKISKGILSKINSQITTRTSAKKNKSGARRKNTVYSN